MKKKETDALFKATMHNKATITALLINVKTKLMSNTKPEIKEAQRISKQDKTNKQKTTLSRHIIFKFQKMRDKEKTF